jgi:cbb3-type cytochrome oxidase subunit 3
MTNKSTNRIGCRYCKEQINENAKVCFHCGHYQNNIQYIKYFATVISIVISICLLVVSIWQYNEAKKEREEAKKALEHAQKAEKKITDSGKAIAKVLLVLSTIKGDMDSLGILQLFPTVMKNRAESLLNTIEVNDKERQDMYELCDKIKKWQQLDLQWDRDQPPPPELTKLEKELEQMINR